DDLTSVISWTAAGQQRSLLAGVSSYEQPDNTPAAVWRFDVASEANKDVIASAPKSAVTKPSGLPCVGPLAVGDIDGDGSLDLFVGGRVVPGRYPEAASSLIYKNNHGTLELDQANSRLLQKVGLVSSALFSDLNGDGFPELILACEWGPVMIFRNDRGQLTPWNPPVALAPSPLNGERAGARGETAPRRSS